MFACCTSSGRLAFLQYLGDGSLFKIWTFHQAEETGSTESEIQVFCVWYEAQSLHTVFWQPLEWPASFTLPLNVSVMPKGAFHIAFVSFLLRKLTWWLVLTILMCAACWESASPLLFSSSHSWCLTAASLTTSESTRTTSAPSTFSTGVCRLQRWVDQHASRPTGTQTNTKIWQHAMSLFT